MQQYRKNNYSVSMVNYHRVGTPKRLKRVLVGDIEERLRAIIWEVCQEKKWAIIAKRDNARPYPFICQRST